MTSLKNVLDVGCGDGNFLSVFLSMGCGAYGTEFDDESRMVAAAKGVIMLEGGLQPSLPPGISGFDLVIFTEVIEHINNSKEVLSNFHDLLNPGGLLFITTPNFASLERRLLGPDWGMIMYPEHISYYSPRTLDRLASDCGFNSVDTYTENISLFRIVQYLNSFRKKSRLDAEIVSAHAQAFVSSNPLAAGIKLVVNRILRITGSGSSLVAIYRRN